MLRFALLRILGAIPTLFFVVLLAFLLIRAAPGGPYDSEVVPPPEVAENLARSFHLDEPLPVQFTRYLNGLLHGDFGPSYRYHGYSVAEIIASAAPLSFTLGGLSLVLAIVIGGALGIIAALRRDTLVDRLVSALAMTGLSVPVFVIGPLLVLVFAVKLGWLPASFTGTESASRLLLPVLTLALPQVAYIARLVRSSLIEALESDFVRTATSQGLRTSTIIWQHAMRPTLLPVLSYLGPAIAAVMTGSVVVEQIFGIPGLGQFFVNSALNRDYTLILGLVIFYATLVILLNLLVDLTYGALDPRIRQ